jgi:hypothetical protein
MTLKLVLRFRGIRRWFVLQSAPFCAPLSWRVVEFEEDVGAAPLCTDLTRCRKHFWWRRISREVGLAQPPVLVRASLHGCAIPNVADYAREGVMDKDRTAEVAHVESVTVSRRSILQGAVHVGGAATLLAVTANRARAAAAKTTKTTKTTKQAAGYQYSPNGGQSCSTCIAFLPPNACRIVEGTISPQGWCKIWQRKS